MIQHSKVSLIAILLMIGVADARMVISAIRDHSALVLGAPQQRLDQPKVNAAVRSPERRGLTQ